MSSLDALGPTAATIIRIGWWLCGISFVIYTWKVAGKKLSMGLIILGLLGPIMWMSVLSMYMLKPISEKHREWKDLLASISILGPLLIVVVSCLVILFYTC